MQYDYVQLNGKGDTARAIAISIKKSLATIADANGLSSAAGVCSTCDLCPTAKVSGSQHSEVSAWRLPQAADRLVSG